MLPSSLPALLPQSIAAILIANVSHLISVLLLDHLCETTHTRGKVGARDGVVAALHIFAPAGIFMSTPYGESLFSALSFAGYLSYAKSDVISSSNRSRTSIKGDLYLLSSGAIFGLSCMVRSNGLFNGLIFAVDVLASLRSLSQGARFRAILRRMTVLTIAGLLIASGFIYPQYIACTEFCGRNVSAADRRPWCDALAPSVYTFVQSYYW